MYMDYIYIFAYMTHEIFIGTFSILNLMKFAFVFMNLWELPFSGKLF